MSNELKITISPGFVSVPSLLTIVFVVLKLTGAISWSWLWVLAPTWIPLAIVVIVLIVGLCIIAAVID